MTVGSGPAYQRATGWQTRRPRLVAGATAPDVTPPAVLSRSAEPGAGDIRELCVRAARRAGVPLDDPMPAQRLEGAPCALGMVERRRRDHDV